VGEARDQDEAIELAQALRPDIVLLDIRLRLGSGIEVARILRKALPETGIILLSAYDYEQYVLAMIRVGVKGYLLKDCSKEELVRAIHTVYQGKMFLQPEIAKKAIDLFLVSDNSGLDEERRVRRLTVRELQVLDLIWQGLRNADIAETLKISRRTAEGHVARILEKLGVKTRTEAVYVATKYGVLQTNSSADNRTP
jgi:DNA-binding NarL/FixJ family response regulator